MSLDRFSPVSDTNAPLLKDAPLFGTAGTPDECKALGILSSLELPAYLRERNLTALEYQCGQGVRIGQKLAGQLKEAAKENGITLSVHAPYFISLSSVEAEKRENSVGYILQSAQAADAMGADRIVVHAGSCGKMSREDALSLAKETLRHARNTLCDAGLSHIHICPETMGKINQLGNLEEVMSLCQVDESFIPCVDFGHLNARTAGGIQTKANYAAILDTLASRLDETRAKNFHVHFSMIEFTQKGGEVRHLTFADSKGFGPDYQPLMELLVERNLTPTIISESAGTQGIDAMTMLGAYQKYRLQYTERK